MESLENILHKCTDKDREIIETYELHVHEAVEELVKGFEEGVVLGLTGKTACTSNDDACEELEFILPTDDFRKVAYALYLLGISAKCAKALAYAFFADMLEHAPAEEENGEE